jgi:hypothetical protein
MNVIPAEAGIQLYFHPDNTQPGNNLYAALLIALDKLERPPGSVGCQLFNFFATDNFMTRELANNRGQGYTTVHHCKVDIGPLGRCPQYRMAIQGQWAPTDVNIFYFGTGNFRCKLSGNR